MSTEEKPMALNPWRPMSNPLDLKHLGKLAEELGEAVAALAAAPLAVDWDDVENELADVGANIFLVRTHFGLGGSEPLPVARPMGGRWRGNTELVTHMGNAVAAVARCMIQGIDELEPVTKRPNREWLEETLTHVSMAISRVISFQHLDRVRMTARSDRKVKHLSAWHGMLA